MKKLILGFGIIFGIFLVAGSISAATQAGKLQPAVPAEVSYEDLGAAKFDTIKVGGEDGGVTFFNGTIVNENTTVTIGDDMRVDGALSRLGVGGDPVKFEDTIMPATNNTYDIGTAAQKWRDGYFSGVVNTRSINVNKRVTAGLLTANVNRDALGSYSFDSVSESTADRPLAGGIDINIEGSELFSEGAVVFSIHGDELDGVLSTDSNASMVIYGGGNIATNGSIWANKTISAYDGLVSYTPSIDTSRGAGYFVGDVQIKGDESRLRGFASGREGGDGDDQPLNLDDIVNIEPRNGQPYVCTNSNKGDLIFSTTAIGGQGQANRYYYCASAAEGWLQLF